MVLPPWTSWRPSIVVAGLLGNLIKQSLYMSWASRKLSIKKHQLLLLNVPTADSVPLHPASPAREAWSGLCKEWQEVNAHYQGFSTLYRFHHFPVNQAM